ncbi:MAG: M20/M25/M40 family metallo-hydrolase [Myxococcales bacterium]|nr:M20/M25/M40 family metallo-hydrolase [Myxococcales bacterium]
MATTRLARTALLCGCVAAGALAWWRSLPPAPRPAEAEAREFSAVRARALLAELLGDEAPHPVGSAANVAVRERLVAQVRLLGLEPRLQEGFACSEWGSCAAVTNVIVEVPGTGGGPAVALAAHYDSVGAGPGAADDGSGTALLLEALRALRASGPHQNPLVAVWTDAEEPGLLGARALVEDPLFAGGGVAAVINVEARGTGGASRMFETSEGNAGLIAAHAATPRPGAHSLSYEVYKLLGNDTDLTIFKRAGLQGLGHAFIGGARRYHTPRDDLAHLDLGSLQQQGDAALGEARALLAADLSVRTAANTSYVDVLGLVLLRWPAAMDVALAIAAVVMLAAAAVVAARRGQVRAGGIAVGMLSGLLSTAAGAGGGYAAVWAIGAASEPLGLWPAGWSLGLATIVLAASAASGAILNVIARRVGGPLAQGLGVWSLWAIVGVVLALVFPGAAILAIAPALLAASGLALAVVRPRPLWPGLAVAGALAFVLWTPLVPALPEALGLIGVLIGAPVGWLWAAASPAWSVGQGERDLAGVPGAVLVAALTCGVFAASAPRFTVDSPQKVNLIHVTDLDSGVVQYGMDAPDGVPREVAAEVAWRAPATLLPWSKRLFHTAPAPRGSGDGPSWIGGGAGDTVTAKIKPRDGALILWLVVPGDVTGLIIGGRALDMEALARGSGDLSSGSSGSESRMVAIFGPPAAGVTVTATGKGTGAWVIADAVAGLPAGARAPVEARPATAVPYQWGDMTAAVRRVQP